MLKNMLTLEGVTELSKTTQKEIKGQGDNDVLACHCPDGSLVIAHGDSCAVVISQFCAQDA